MNRHRQRLAGELMLLIVAGLCIGVLLFFGLRQVSYTILDNELFNWTSIANQESKTVASLQKFINEKDLSLEDVNQLDEWAKKHQDVYITLYYDNSAVFSSQSKLEVQMLTETSSTLENTDPAYPIYFTDAEVQMISYATFENYYRAADTVSAVISFIVFLGIVLYSIRRKLNYIMKIETELKILGGGDLTYPITISGNDELTSLAEEVERMRCALLERQETEQAALDANRGLVTAMSHDLRTPLTALIGYLELLKLDSGDLEQQSQYLQSASQKAEHIKALSDQLFAYFLVFQKDSESLSLTHVNGAEFWIQFVEEFLFDLEMRGFTIERETEPILGSLELDVDLILRVFNNLSSNIIKYADSKGSIRVKSKIKDEKLYLHFENRIGIKESRDSTEIGLKTCEKILKMHQGTFTWSKGESFIVNISLPYKQK